VSGVVFIETVRRHVTNGAYLTVLLITTIIAAVAGGIGAPAGLWTSVVNLAGIVLACQLIGPEFSSGTLQLVLAKPVNRSAYLLSRYGGVVVAIAIFFLLPALFDTVCRVFVNEQHFAAAMFASPVNTAASFIIAAALFALFGSMSRSYINVAIYFVLETGLYGSGAVLRGMESGGYSISPFFKAHPGIRLGVTKVTENLFPQVAQSFDWRWIVMVVSNAALALLLACLVFRQREVPYGAD
jgi:ABC-type transport system involved in multi-copper enzyme maturation permease subunit